MTRDVQEHISTRPVNLSRTTRYTCQQQKAVHMGIRKLVHYTGMQMLRIHAHSSETGLRTTADTSVTPNLPVGGTELCIGDLLRPVNQTDASDTHTYMQGDANDLKTRQNLSEALKNEPKMPYLPGGSTRSQASDV